MENLSATSYARDYHMTAELAATKDGRIKALRCHVLADHGAFDACADPTKYPAGFFHICTGSTTSRPRTSWSTASTPTRRRGVAYRCSFRVTEASYMIERIVDVLARSRHGPGGPAGQELHPPRAVPLHVLAGNMTAATTTRPCRKRWMPWATPICARSKPRSGPRAS